ADLLCTIFEAALHGALHRTRAKRCLLAAGPLTRLTGFVQHELYRRPAPILAHFLVLLEIFRDRIRALGWRWPSIRTLVRPVDIIDAGLSASTPIYGLPIGIR